MQARTKVRTAPGLRRTARVAALTVAEMGAAMPTSDSFCFASVSIFLLPAACFVRWTSVSARPSSWAVVQVGTYDTLLLGCCRLACESESRWCLTHAAAFLTMRDGQEEIQSVSVNRLESQPDLLCLDDGMTRPLLACSVQVQQPIGSLHGSTRAATLCCTAYPT